MEYTIRHMRASDRDAVYDVFLHAAKPRDLGNEELNQAFQAAASVLFFDYYVERETENCFVAADERDTAKGYVFCAPDFDAFWRRLTEEYLDRPPVPIVRAMGEGTLEGLKAFCEDYPAHLHIDILPQLQRQGVGSRLLDALTAELRQRKVKGIMLNVAPDNEKGIRFYEKYGFVLLEKGEQEWSYGMNLQAEL